MPVVERRASRSGPAAVRADPVAGARAASMPPRSPSGRGRSAPARCAARLRASARIARGCAYSASASCAGPRPRASRTARAQQPCVQWPDAGSDRPLLRQLGEDPEREGLRDTPKRVEKSLQFLTSGYQADIDEVINNALFSVDYSEMVIVKDIDFYSLCEHHLLPFFGKCHVAYIPQKRVIGLSKIPRLVDVFSRRLQVQERLTHQIAQVIQEKSPARRRRGHGRHAPLHGDARRREAELVRGHQRDARRLPRERPDAQRIPGADSPPGRRRSARSRCRRASRVSPTEHRVARSWPCLLAWCLPRRESGHSREEKARRRQSRRPQTEAAALECPNVLGDGVKSGQRYCDIVTATDVEERRGHSRAAAPRRRPRELRSPQSSDVLRGAGAIRTRLYSSARDDRRGGPDGTVLQRNAVLERVPHGSRSDRADRRRRRARRRQGGRSGRHGKSRHRRAGGTTMPSRWSAKALSITRMDGNETVRAPGRPIAVVSNAQVQYQPAPPKKTAPPKKKPARRTR